MIVKASELRDIRPLREIAPGYDGHRTINNLFGGETMMPISEINIGDIYSNPSGRGYGKLSGLEWYVIEKKEKMVKIQAHKYGTTEPFGPPIWKKNTDRMFCESWRVLNFKHPF